MNSLFAKYGTSEEVVMGHTEAIVAHAGGGQTSASQLTTKFNRIDTCASGGDSVKLIAAKQGMKQYVFNNSTNEVALFPTTGEKIVGITNFQFNLQAGTITCFECQKDASWNVLSEDVLGVLRRRTVTVTDFTVATRIIEGVTGTIIMPIMVEFNPSLSALGAGATWVIVQNGLSTASANFSAVAVANRRTMTPHYEIGLLDGADIVFEEVPSFGQSAGSLVINIYFYQYKS